jgi:Flp pilus assembly protein TadG
MLHNAFKLARCQSGNFAVMFALLLPVLAAILAFIGDQVNIARIASRIETARDAATVAVAHEYMASNKSHRELEAYAKAFFIANLGQEYEKAARVELILTKPGPVFQLKTSVKYEPYLAPLYAAVSRRPGSRHVIEFQ